MHNQVLVVLNHGHVGLLISAKYFQNHLGTAVFESIDKKIPRTTSQQIDLGKKVSLKKSREGDLVFFAFGKSKRKVTHVGLISNCRTSSDIDFIHASSSRGVVETQLVKDYFNKIKNRLLYII